MYKTCINIRTEHQPNILRNNQRALEYHGITDRKLTSIVIVISYYISKILFLLFSVTDKQINLNKIGRSEASLGRLGIIL